MIMVVQRICRAYNRFVCTIVIEAIPNVVGGILLIMKQKMRIKLTYKFKIKQKTRPSQFAQCRTHFNVT